MQRFLFLFFLSSFSFPEILLFLPSRSIGVVEPGVFEIMVGGIPKNSSREPNVVLPSSSQCSFSENARKQYEKMMRSEGTHTFEFFSFFPFLESCSGWDEKSLVREGVSPRRDPRPFFSPGYPTPPVSRVKLQCV